MPVERVWAATIEPDELAHWLAARVNIQMRVGARFDYVLDEADGLGRPGSGGRTSRRTRKLDGEVPPVGPPRRRDPVTQARRRIIRH